MRKVAKMATLHVKRRRGKLRESVRTSPVLTRDEWGLVEELRTRFQKRQRFTGRWSGAGELRVESSFPPLPSPLPRGEGTDRRKLAGTTQLHRFEDHKLFVSRNGGAVTENLLQLVVVVEVTVRDDHQLTVNLQAAAGMVEHLPGHSIG